MRLLAALVLSAFAWSSAWAQEALSDSLADRASRNYLDAMFTPEVMESVLAPFGESMRQDLVNSEFFRGVSAESQSALRAYADTLPQLMREEVVALRPVFEEELALRLDTRFNDVELRALADLFGEPTFRDALSDFATAQLRGEAAELEQMPAARREPLEAIINAATANGAPHPGEVTRLAAEAREAAQRTRMPFVLQRFAREMCAVLNDECPDHIRRMAAAQPPN